MRTRTIRGVMIAMCAVLAVTVFSGDESAGVSAQDSKPAPKAKKQPPAPKRSERMPIENRPYRVRVSIAFNTTATITPRFRDRFMKSLRHAVGRGFGKMWDADFVENNWLTPATDNGLKRLSSDSFRTRFPELHADGTWGYDKVYLLTVEVTGPQYHVAGCEWDQRSRRLTRVETAGTYQRREAAAVAYSLLPRLFNPVLEIERIKGNQVELRLQAATIPPLDPALQQLREDDVVIPYFRYMDKQKVVQRIQFLPWTYLLIDGVQKQYVDASVISPYFRNPLGSGNVRLVELQAIRQRPWTGESRLKMVYQTDETKPLIGYHISLIPKRSYREPVDKPPEKQFSGRDGFVFIPVDRESPITWVYVYSGTALLARVPYVPGLAKEDVIPLPDDSIRLALEGDLELLQSRLIETVARRATLMALAQKTADDTKLPYDEKWRKVDEKFREINDLPKAAEFRTQLTSLREPALSAATRLGNRFALTRIRKMCTGVDELILRHLDSEPVEKLRTELNQQRKR